MYRRAISKGKAKVVHRRKDDNQRDGRYSSSNFKLVSYGPKRDKSPAWERDKRISGRLTGRNNSGDPKERSPSQEGGKRSSSRDGERPKSRERRARSKSPKERSVPDAQPIHNDRPILDKTVLTDKILDNHTDDKEGRKEDISKEFHVEDIDFNIKENTVDHHTDKFECTCEREKDGKKLKPDLVVRRGQPFTLTIRFNTEYEWNQHDLEFSFTTGDNPKPPKRTAAQFRMDEIADGIGHHKDWNAEMVATRNNSIKVAITPPSDCIIGEWNFSVLTSYKNKPEDKPVICQYVCDRDVTILLNPWCEHDEVYLPTTKLLDEYISNDTGAVFQGNYKQINAKVWNFAQHEDDLLDICLHLIRKQFGGKVDPGMGDPIKLSRAITEIVNANDGGVLEGNWTGNYEGGTSPLLWSSSKTILKQYAKNGEAVKYGQCWVFSAVTTTICRAIGLPARSVTNYASAHDQDGSVSIDEEYVYDKEKGKFVKLPGDSIWNFHVWNEVWMARNDLGRGYDGWQVIDSTPQELSGGVFRCGPAPVSAIKRGELGRMQYDLPFVFAEVNADVIKWEKQSSSKWRKVKVDSSKVGKNISTKRPDGLPYKEGLSLFSFLGDSNDQRMDITNEYKYPEGTLEERLAVKNAAKASLSAREVEEVEHDDVVLEIVDKDGILIGNSFDVEVKTKNQSIDHKVRTVTVVHISVQTVAYTGVGGQIVGEKRFKEDVRLKYNEEKTFKLTLNPEDYLDKLQEQYMMIITATCHVKETDKVHIQDEDYRLRRPDIEVKAPAKGKCNKPFEIELTLNNPLPKPLTNCIVYVEGNKITDVKENTSDIPAKSPWKHKMIITATRSGNVTLNVNMDCKELKDIAGTASVDIEQ